MSGHQKTRVQIVIEKADPPFEENELRELRAWAFSETLKIHKHFRAGGEEIGELTRERLRTIDAIGRKARLRLEKIEARKIKST